MELPGCWKSMSQVLGPAEVPAQWVIEVLRDVAQGQSWGQWVELLADILADILMGAQQLPDCPLTPHQQSLQDYYVHNRKEGARWLEDADRAAECWN